MTPIQRATVIAWGTTLALFLMFTFTHYLYTQKPLVEEMKPQMQSNPMGYSASGSHVDR